MKFKVSTEESIENLASAIARDIFKCGDEPDSPVRRIQHMGGWWTEGSEVNQGGLCEESLKAVIASTLKKNWLPL